MKFAVFDVDGTLADSRAAIKASADAAFAALNRPPPTYEAVRQIVGLSLQEGLSRLAPDLSPDELNRFIAGYREGFAALRRVRGSEDRLYPGAADLLLRVKATGWHIGMATGKSRAGVDRWLVDYGWQEVFDTNHCADDGPGKPDPAMLQAAMAAVGAEPHQTVMIGDTTHDVTMAKAAGVACIAVTWGFHTVEELQAAEADLICTDFDQLWVALTRFERGETLSGARGHAV